MDSVAYDLVLILGLVAANGLFAATEIAVLSVRKTRISQLAAEHHPGARAVLKLRENPERFLATVQVGITALGAATAAYGEGSLGQKAEAWLREVPALSELAHTIAFTLTIVGVTFLSVVLGELVPKSLALRAPEAVALTLGRPLRALASIARPAVWLLTRCSNLLLRSFGDKTSFTESRLSAQELQDLVEEAARAGQLDLKTADIASRALELPELTAGDVMRPRTQLNALTLTADPDEVRDFLALELPDRLPVCERGMDSIVGYVVVKELVGPLLSHSEWNLAAHVHEPLFVPASLSAVRLLSRMRADGVPFAVVIDGSGGTRGLVELPDLLEEVVGDLDSDPSGPPDVTTEQDGALLVPGPLPVRQLNRDYALDLPDGPDFSTVAGLCLDLAGAIPVRGTVLSGVEGLRLEITESDNRAVRWVRIRRTK